MYGLIIESFIAYIKLKFGEGKWESVRKNAGVESNINVHNIYAEGMVNKITKSAVAVLDVSEKEFMEEVGNYFVVYITQYGYDQVMSRLGRYMRNFLNGLDNLHDYLKISYPKMRPPSFYCEEESESGLTLHYRTKRKGFSNYVIGLIKYVAENFYKVPLKIEAIGEKMEGDTNHVTFKLEFENKAYKLEQSLKKYVTEEEKLPIRQNFFLKIFPFCIIFNEQMTIVHFGMSSLRILKDWYGFRMSEVFKLLKPACPFNYKEISKRQNNIFELITLNTIGSSDELFLDEDDESKSYLKLKGQMYYIEAEKMIIFLSTPVVEDLTALLSVGLYLNDLSIHDSSREMLLSSTQTSMEYKIALEREIEKTKILQENMKKFEEEMRKKDEIYYQRVPKKVADIIKSGMAPEKTFKEFTETSVLFSKINNFDDIGIRLQPKQIVFLINQMYTIFDQLIERNNVHKVVTVRDTYMAVCGAPNKDKRHAEKICDMALDILDSAKGIKMNLEQYQEDIKIEYLVGVNTGVLVAGVVGIKNQRYGLFGMTVNIASRMQVTCEPGKIQISEDTVKALPKIYQTETRGEIPVKGRDPVKSHWLNSRDKRVGLSDKELSKIAAAEQTLAFLKTSSIDLEIDDVMDMALSVISTGSDKAARMKKGKMQLKRLKTKASTISSVPDSILEEAAINASNAKVMNLDTAKVAVNKSIQMRKLSNRTEALKDNKPSSSLTKAESMSAEERIKASEKDETLAIEITLDGNIENPSEQNGAEMNTKGGKLNAKLGMLRNNLQKNKVGMMATKALDKMGCPGFGSRQEIISKSCSLI